MRRILAVAAVGAAVLAAGAAPAGATDECDGLQVCVPVAGPWVVVPATQSVPRPRVEYRLSCPRGYTAGGVDAELSIPPIDIGFLGALGSPVNPGVTTSRAVVFLASYVGGPARGRVPSFKPHVGCMPSSGGGRTLTSARVVRPGKPTVRHVTTIRVYPGVQAKTLVCSRNERLIAATHAVGFYASKPPGARLAGAVKVEQQVGAGAVLIQVRASTAMATVSTVVQVSLVCAGGV